MSRKLSTRAVHVLAAIDQETEWEGDERPGRSLARFWTPRLDAVWVAAVGKLVWVGEVSDAPIIRMFLRRGFIKREAVGTFEQAFSITEKGILALSTALARADAN